MYMHPYIYSNSFCALRKFHINAHIHPQAYKSMQTKSANIVIFQLQKKISSIMKLDFKT